MKLLYPGAIGLKPSAAIEDRHCGFYGYDNAWPNVHKCTTEKIFLKVVRRRSSNPMLCYPDLRGLSVLQNKLLFLCILS